MSSHEIKRRVISLTPIIASSDINVTTVTSLADVIGFEPITNRLTGDRSAIELHIQIGGE